MLSRLMMPENVCTRESLRSAKRSFDTLRRQSTYGYIHVAIWADGRAEMVYLQHGSPSPINLPSRHAIRDLALVKRIKISQSRHNFHIF
eukprot:jgi/Botrbrau1/23012/Bobra.136_1s0004.1